MADSWKVALQRAIVTAIVVGITAGLTAWMADASTKVIVGTAVIPALAVFGTRFGIEGYQDRPK